MTRRALLPIICLAAVLLSASLAGAQPDLSTIIRIPRQPVIRLLQAPDLTVALKAPSRALPGDNINVQISVSNAGVVEARGSEDEVATKAYFVDLDLSSDKQVPVELAVQPVYQGLTEEDFVEDMLTLGGRVSKTKSLAPGAQTAYSLSTHIPSNIEPGNYFLAAVVDPANRIAESNENNNVYLHPLLIGVPEPAAIDTPSNVNVWVMPYGVGGTRLDRIKPTGLVDYGSVQDAPWGSRLGFRMAQADVIPTPQFRYYRWLYRPQGTSGWTEFEETVRVHYVKDLGGTITFPVYVLGPKSVGGKTLYEFRPHDPPAEPPARTYWPTTDWFADIYSAFLNTVPLTDGAYDIKLEVYNQAGVLQTPGPGTFRFLVPTGVGPDDAIQTAVATSLDGAGVVFPLHIDNRHCTAAIDPVAIGQTTSEQACGFLLYGDKSDEVRIGFHARHPEDFAWFHFRVVRNISNVDPAGATGEVSATSVGAYAGSNSHFTADFTVSELLGICPTKAAFSANLYVYAKATTGWGHRISAYDAIAIRAFALAPEENTVDLVPMM